MKRLHVTHVTAAHLRLLELQVTWHLNCNVILTKHTLSKHTVSATHTAVKQIYVCGSTSVLDLVCVLRDFRPNLEKL